MHYCSICNKEPEYQERPESKLYYHEACLRKLFGVKYCPAVEFSLSEISIKAKEMAGKISISGVQPKLSMKLNKKKKCLEVTGEGGKYILKPQQQFQNIPQNENLCMSIASELGIEVPLHALISLKDNTSAYIVKRYDRTNGKKLHQESFYQIFGEENKYGGSLEKIASKLNELSEFPMIDLQFFFERILLFFIIGNGDAHLKNFSIIYNRSGKIRLSPAYDVLSSKLIIPEEEDSALSINGKKNKITGKDFRQFAESMKIRTEISYKRILGKIDVINKFVKHSYLTGNEKDRLLEIIKERVRRLNKT